jgi:hypothetical protein
MKKTNRRWREPGEAMKHWIVLGLGALFFAIPLFLGVDALVFGEATVEGGRYSSREITLQGGGARSYGAMLAGFGLLGIGCLVAYGRREMGE